MARRAARRFKYVRSATLSPEPHKSSERSRQPRARCEKGADELMSQPIACYCRQRKSNACYARHNEQPRRLRSGKQCQKVVHRPYPPCKTRIESLRAPGAYAEPGGTSFPFELVRAPWLKTLFLGLGGPARTYRKAECRSTRHLDEDRLERIADADYDAPVPPRRTHELAMLPSHRIPLGARDDRIRPLASPVDIFFRPAGLLAHRPRPRFDAIRWRVSCGPSARCKMIGRLAIVIRHAVRSARLCRGVKKSALRA